MFILFYGAATGEQAMKEIREVMQVTLVMKALRCIYLLSRYKHITG